jgi:hypothetical protein
MYIYQVTNLTTGQFYIAGTTDPRTSFDPTKRVDPHDQFLSKLPAGSPIFRSIEKRMLTVVSSTDQLANALTQYAAQYAENPKFLGVLGSIRSTETSRTRIKPEPVTPESTLQKSEPVKTLKTKFDTES